MEALKYAHQANKETAGVKVRELPYQQEIGNKLEEALSNTEGTIKDICMHIFNSGGKRIRPLLVLYSGLVFDKMSSRLINAAVASELIHMASLIHDDIIDNAKTRRGKLSINYKWGNHFGVLGGDYLFAKAFGILANNRLMQSMDFMVEAIQNMCQGEILQAKNRFKTDSDIEMYYKIISRKTAIFMQCCCKSGASTAGADNEGIKALGDYGLNLGMAFQIVDDILDFCGNANVMGKPKREDLPQGNVTLPVIMLLKNSKYGEQIKRTIDDRRFTTQVLDDITALLRKEGIIEKCFKIAALHVEKAKNSLQSIHKSRGIDLLFNIAEMMKYRVT